MKVVYYSPEVAAMEIVTAEALLQASVGVAQEDFVNGGDFVW